MWMNISVPSERKVLVSQFTNKMVNMFSHVVNITLHFLKLWQQFGSQLLYWNAEGCTSYVCHIFIQKYTFTHYCKILIERDCFKMFELLRISQYLAAPVIVSHGWLHGPQQWPLFNLMCTSVLGLFCPGSSSVLPLYPSTMHPFSTSSSRLLTLIVFWMFIHCQNL